MANDSEVEWRDVVGYEGIYQVSEDGQVRRVLAARGTRTGVLKQSCVGAGYLSVQLSADNIAKRFYVHRLVALAFIGPGVEGHEVCHGQGGKEDNSVGNLRWDTHSENHFDITRQGLRPTACKRGHEYTEDNVYRNPKGRRECRRCRANNGAKRRKTLTTGSTKP